MQRVVRWLVVACALASARIWAADRYLSTTGADGGGRDGSPALPWLTFSFALSQLRAGDTLWLEDGLYTDVANGTVSAFCPEGPSSGTAGAHVTVRAVHERQAIIEVTGSGPAISLLECQYWDLIGLTIVLDDALSIDTQPGVAIAAGDHISLQRLLVKGTNRFSSSVALSVSATDSSIEECELYDFSGVGIELSANTRVSRCYLNSRARDDIDGGVATAYPSRGDIAVDVRGSLAVVENTISEGQGLGFQVAPEVTAPDHATLVGNISLRDLGGIVVTPRGSQLQPTFTRIIDQVVYSSSTSGGVRFVSAVNSTCTRCTVLDGDTGFLLARDLGSDGGSSTYLDGCLAAFVANDGFVIINQDDYEWTSCAAFMDGFAYAPSSVPPAQRPGFTTFDPQLGNCVAYLPVHSPLRGAAIDGGDIGASIVFRSVDGGLTDQPLWDPVTGAFPCGATVAGINDDPATSCTGVHQRLNVGSGGCPLPFQYLDAGSGADAGAAADAGREQDAGADAGELDDAGHSDGGDPNPPNGQDAGVPGVATLKVGCGCNATTVPLSLVALAVVQVLRRPGRRGFSGAAARPTGCRRSR